VAAIAWLLLRGGPAGPSLPDEQWQPFASTEAHFEILFPGTPIPRREQAANPAGRFDLDTFVLERKDPNLALMVSYLTVPAEGPTALPLEQRFEGAREGARANLGGTVRKETPVTLGSYPGREWEIDVPDKGIAVQRLYIVRSGDQLRLYTLGVFGSSVTAEADVARTGDSLPVPGARWETCRYSGVGQPDSGSR